MISRLPSFTMEYSWEVSHLGWANYIILASCPAHVGGSLYGPMAFTEAQCRLMPHTRLNHEILKCVKVACSQWTIDNNAIGHHQVIYSPDIVDGKLDLGYRV